MGTFDRLFDGSDAHLLPSSWQPIETAPTTPNTRVIIFAPSEFHDEGTVGEAFLGKDGFWYWAGCEEGYHDPIFESNAPPTHWQPLPDRP